MGGFPHPLPWWGHLPACPSVCGADQLRRLRQVHGAIAAGLRGGGPAHHQVLGLGPAPGSDAVGGGGSGAGPGWADRPHPHSRQADAHGGGSSGGEQPLRCLLLPPAHTALLARQEDPKEACGAAVPGARRGEPPLLLWGPSLPTPQPVPLTPGLQPPAPHSLASAPRSRPTNPLLPPPTVSHGLLEGGTRGGGPCRRG